MHGGDIYRNNIDLDFSININPLGMPQEAWEAVTSSRAELLRYPDMNCDALRKKLSEYHNISEKRIVCGNGASELIGGICFMTKAQKALINAPSFSGYERSLNNCGTRIYYNYLNAQEHFKLTDAFASKIESINPQLVFVTNPNNPDGNLVDETVRREIVLACEAADSLLIADECFIEMTEENESASFLNEAGIDNHLIVLRAFTKSYGMPGLRLGYAICSDEHLAEELTQFLCEWNVSSIAQRVGTQVAGDRIYLQKSRELISNERKYLTKELTGLGMKVYPSDANFILFEDTVNADGNLYELMLNRGILIRDCSDYMGLKSGHYRIAIRTHEENKKLVEALREVR